MRKYLFLAVIGFTCSQNIGQTKKPPTIPARTHPKQLLTQQLLDEVESGSTQKVKELLQKGANPDAENISGFTPLMLAAMKDYYDIAVLLLEYNADPDIKRKGFGTAAEIAFKFNNKDIQKLILDKTGVRSIIGKCLHKQS
ncbi:hypothetical protein A3F66_00555 [candidate division TM6 bacterium RIFCSPHIGHO2_12_FULL_32_22]|nr:MAG: hypothetical protein A3F66_00555 [candidate division TM6 bacterium RIFCSPHIGHO2_12_FULL_32_22]